MKKHRIIVACTAAIGIGLLWLVAGQQSQQLLPWLAQHRDLVTSFVDQHYLLAAVGYCLFYMLATALSFPGASLLTLMGGWLFGVIIGTCATVIGATLGAVMIFGVARLLYRQQKMPPILLQKPLAQKMIAAFRQHGFSWLLVLRLVPIFPFWLINLVPAATDMPVRTYVIATFIGIIPGSLVYVAAGHGLGALLTQPGSISGALLWRTEIILPLFGLALLALLPVFYHHWRQKDDAQKI